MSYRNAEDIAYCLNFVAGTLSGDVPQLEAQGAANVWAATSNLSLVGALNIKAGTVGLDLAGVLNYLVASEGLDSTGAANLLLFIVGDGSYDPVDYSTEYDYLDGNAVSVSAGVSFSSNFNSDFE